MKKLQPKVQTWTWRNLLRSFLFYFDMKRISRKTLQNLSEEPSLDRADPNRPAGGAAEPQRADLKLHSSSGP
ncbi:hypothetical protein OJAV_G00084960 [Oryzias javanicus]|uniref:Uncharacterized protein n=1 Tax=Oryzias javanicus TaxID=123683 RepID=A0A3S2M4F2_ORYJA|nr:hypothetical protein OJAV_G00084960 [Oryzias javanicus]